MGNFIPLLSPQSPVSIREDLLSIKGLVQAAVKGLAEDDTHVVYAVLHAFFLGGINEDRHSLDLRCQIVEESSQPLLNLAISSNADIAVHSQRFLLATVSTLTQPGSSHSHQQQQMQTTHLRARKCLNALLTAVRPGDHASHAELALCILRQCPELLSGSVFFSRVYTSAPNVLMYSKS